MSITYTSGRLGKNSLAPNFYLQTKRFTKTDESQIAALKCGFLVLQ